MAIASVSARAGLLVIVRRSRRAGSTKLRSSGPQPPGRSLLERAAGRLSHIGRLLQTESEARLFWLPRSSGDKTDPVTPQVAGSFHSYQAFATPTVSAIAAPREPSG